MSQQIDIPEPEFVVAAIPHSREAEEAVIGALLIAPELLPEIELKADDFYIHRLRFIWQAFERLRNRRLSIDILTVSEELHDMGRLDEIGGQAYLTALLNQCPTTLHAASYAEIVKATSLHRSRLTIANNIASKAYAGDLDIARELDALARSSSIKRSADGLGADLAALYDYVEERRKNPVDVWGISTGLADLDKMTGGLHPEQVTLVMGAPEAGKTRLVLQIGLHAAQSGKGVAIYELEMDKKRILMRMVEMLGGPTPRQMQKGGVRDDQWESFNQAIETLDRLPLYISDSPSLTTAQLGADLAKLQATNSVELVVLDYMNLLGDADGRDDNEKSVLRSRRFRNICRERRVAGLSVQSINKAGMAQDTPELKDMSGAAGVQFDADQVFAISPNKEQPGMVNLTPRKGRDLEARGIIPLYQKGILFVNATLRDGK